MRPTSALVYSQPCSPAKNLTDKMYDISMLPIFQPFSLFCNAHAGKLRGWTDCTDIIPKSPNLIVLSFNLCDPFHGCSWKTEEIVLFKLESSSVLALINSAVFIF